MKRTGTVTFSTGMVLISAVLLLSGWLPLDAHAQTLPPEAAEPYPVEDDPPPRLSDIRWVDFQYPLFTLSGVMLLALITSHSNKPKSSTETDQAVANKQNKAPPGTYIGSLAAAMWVTFLTLGNLAKTKLGGSLSVTVGWIIGLIMFSAVFLGMCHLILKSARNKTAPHPAKNPQ